jgi:hypothetical protein
MKFSLLVVSIALIVVSGCHSSDPTEPPPFPAPPTIAGTWNFTATNEFALDMTITQFRNHVSGDGMMTVYPSGQTYEADVAGGCTYPSVTLTLYLTGYVPIVFTGTIVGNSTITGVLNQSGFTDFPITWTKVKQQ